MISKTFNELYLVEASVLKWRRQTPASPRPFRSHRTFSERYICRQLLSILHQAGHAGVGKENAPVIDGGHCSVTKRWPNRHAMRDRGAWRVDNAGADGLPAL